MSGRGDSRAGGDRTTSPVQDGGNRRSGRNDGYESPNNDFQQRRQECIDSYDRYKEKLNATTVDEGNPCGYTQQNHEWLKGCCQYLHSLDIQVIDMDQAVSESNLVFDCLRLGVQKQKLVNKRCNMGLNEEYTTIRDKFNKYYEWKENQPSQQ